MYLSAAMKLLSLDTAPYEVTELDFRKCRLELDKRFTQARMKETSKM